MTDSALLVDKREVAKRLGVSERMVDSLIFSGSLASCAIGRRRLIAVADLEAFVERLRAENQPQLAVVSLGRTKTG
jgi:excisionase family DNA binding protein